MDTTKTKSAAWFLLRKMKNLKLTADSYIRKKPGFGAEIQKVKQSISKTKTRYDKLAERLQKLEKQKRAMQADKIMDAFEKSGKSYKELMTFLGA